jgi:hypothetical protein
LFSEANRRRIRIRKSLEEEERTVPEHDVKLGKIRFEEWLTQPAQIRGAHAQPTGVAVGTAEKETRKKAR